MVIFSSSFLWNFLNQTFAFWGWGVVSICVFSGILFAHYQIWAEPSVTPFQILVIGSNFTFLCGILTFLVITILKKFGDGIKNKKNSFFSKRRRIKSFRMRSQFARLPKRNLRNL
ncbi:hypothetical protein LEP1GSC043_0036 [Leptospira weilii str. Ecochallenge]|uniref:Uncharacterized protein n=1 Tax=Leptospira weilii str. Ecochallenge TaxID=1049986 RepID=N1U4K3_9LEPT|nr:hypothetical protein LEP1GSC043_0036 [Leptospira weilii str. Ecochallenge]